MAVVWTHAAQATRPFLTQMEIPVVSKPFKLVFWKLILACDTACSACIEGSPTSCLSCPSGKFLSGATCVSSCPSGLVAEEGLCKGSRGEDENLCAPGKYNDLTGQQSSSACKTCPPGKYCAGFKATAVTGNCGGGYYCSSNAELAKNIDDAYGIGVTNPTGGRCAVGNYCPEGSNAQIACPEGKYCLTAGLTTPTGDCQAGYYCITGSNTPTPDGSNAAIGMPCPAGSYCVAGQKAQQCPLGTYLPYTGATSLNECISCDPGSYCDAEGATAPKGTCQQGYYCEGGATSAQQTICPKGYFCAAASPAPSPCALTHYQDQTGQSSCIACPAGFYCTEEAKIVCPAGYYCLANNDKKPCPPGSYRSTTGGQDSTACSSCPAGYACLNHAMTSGVVTACAAGYYCSGGATTDMPKTAQEGGGLCTKGNYCPLGSSAQTACDAGKYCANQGLSQPSGSCQAGYYCSGGAATSIPTGSGGNICSTGRYCPAGSSAEQQCPNPSDQYINYEGADSSNDCLSCPAGKVCADGKISVTLCAAGYYCDHSGITWPCEAGYKCPEGSNDQIPCEPGTYQSQTLQSTCLNCPAGKYCEGLKTSSPTDCPEGYYCQEGTYSRYQYPCPPGYRGAGTGFGTLATGCSLCDAGKYCHRYAMTSSDISSCAAGFFCEEGAKVATPYEAGDSINGLTKAGPCPAGHYCPQGSQAGTACPKGTYRPYTGGRSESDCMPVPPGKFSTQTGLTALPSSSSSTYGDCTAGYYCSGGSYEPAPSVSTIGVPCSIGHYCPAGTTRQIECDPGWYQDTTQQAACKRCTSGNYCPDPGMSAQLTCPAGHYCQQTGSSTDDGPAVPTPCPRGTYQPSTGTSALTSCISCPAGYACTGLGLTDATVKCAAGYVCTGGSDTVNPDNEGYANPGNLISGLCPKGYQCSQGTLLPEQCNPGYYNPSLGQATCPPCAPGYFCNGVAITSLDSSRQCAAGYVCTEGSSTDSPSADPVGHPCPAGHFCLSGTAVELGCEDGKLQTLTGQSACTNCAAGKRCQASTELTCAANKYCPEGSSYGTNCPNGRYNAAGTGLTSGQECTLCDAGKFCMGGYLMSSCQRGYFCESGADNPTPSLTNAQACLTRHYCTDGATQTACAATKYTLYTGSLQSSDCIDCPLGFTCTDATQDKCPMGSYCRNGVATRCPLYTYNNQTEMSFDSHCKPCPAGYFCNSQGVGDLEEVDSISSQKTYHCDAGYYCVERATQQIACPAGTYNLGNAKSLAECLPCPSGYYCGTATGTPLLCDDNFFCNASSYAAPCPLKQQCTIQDNATPGAAFPKLMVNETCPAGNYCEFGNLGPQVCASGKFCQAGSAYEQPCELVNNACVECPAGQYRFGIQSCSACEAGYVCLGGTTTRYPLSETTDKGYECPVGNYCPQGSSAPTPCPVGTYNPSTRGVSTASCLACPDGSFNAQTGQSTCQSCGASATNNEARTSCTCLGAFRTFLMNDKSCRCQPGYTHELSADVSSTDNCHPIELPTNCDFDHLGKCGTSCAQVCGGDYSELTEQKMCQCSAASTLPACDASCQQEFLSLTLTSNNRIVIRRLSAGQFVSFDITTETTFFGSPSCSGSCKLVSVVSGGLTSYEPSQYFVDKFKASYSTYSSTVRNLQTVQTNFQQPVICIAPDTTVTFDTSTGVYPIYQKDSLLNSNPDFDYSQFELLASHISQGGASFSNFFFTFTQQGVYVFADSNNEAYTYVYQVSSTLCDTSVTLDVSELTSSNLANKGVKVVSGRVITEISYAPIAGLLVVFLLLLIVGSVLLAWCCKLDRFDHEFVEIRGGIDHSKAASDVRLMAVKRKLQELMQFLSETKQKQKKLLSGKLEAENLDKLDKLKREIEMLLETLGLTLQNADDLLDDSISSLLTDYSSQQTLEDIDGFIKPEDFKEQQHTQGETTEEEEEDQNKEQEPSQQRSEDVIQAEQLPDEHKDVIDNNELRRQVERKRAQFEAEIRNQKMDEDERKKKVEEFEAGLEAMKRSLLEEQEKQKMHLIRKLKLRKQQKIAPEDEQKLQEIEEKEKELKQEQEQENKKVFAEFSQFEQQIEEDYEKKLKEMKREDIKEKNEALKKFKEDFHRRLKGVADPAEIRRLQEEHERQYKEFLQTLEKEQDQQNKSRYMKLAERKQRKLAAARIKFNEVMQEQDEKHKKQMMDEVLKEKMEMQAMAGVGAQELERMDSSSEEMNKMKEQQDLQRKVEMNVLQEEQNVDKNLMENEFRRKEKELEEAAQRGELRTLAEEEMQQKREELKKKIQGEASEEEKKRLMRQLAEEEQKVKLMLDSDQRGQKLFLEKRKLELRHKRELKMLEVDRENEEARVAKELDILRAQDKEREQAQITNLFKVVEEKLRAKIIEKQQLPMMVDNTLNDLFTSELKHLLNRQFIELSRSLAAQLSHMMKSKRLEERICKEEAEASTKAADLENLGAEEFRRRLERIENRREDELKNIEAKYQLKQMDEEGRLRTKLAKKHLEEKEGLQQDQNSEKSAILDEIIERYGGDDAEMQNFLKRIKEKLMMNTAEEMRDYQNSLRREHQQNIDDIKKKLFFENEEELADFEDKFEKELQKERERIEKKLEADKKDLIQKRRKSFEERLKRMEGLAQANVDMFIEEHNENMKRLDNALETEREKQLTNMREKMKIRKLKQEKMRLMEAQRKEKARASLKSAALKAKVLSRLGTQKIASPSKQQRDIKTASTSEGVNYKILVREWGEKVKSDPPVLNEPIGVEGDVSETFISYGPFTQMDDARKRGSSSRTMREDGLDEDILERLNNIERLAKRLLRK